MASTCVYKTVTLQNGEKFVLPSGAEIVSATDPSLITSDCVNLDNLEIPVCYGFILVARQDWNSGRSQPYDGEGDDLYYDGVYLNNVFYPFPAGTLYWGSGPSPEDALASLPFGNLITNVCSSSSDDSFRNSYKTYIIFNTIPSIGDNLILKAQTDAPNSSSGIPQVEFRIPCKTREDIIAEGNSGVCNCLE
jgi:hypothetical protein